MSFQLPRGETAEVYLVKLPDGRVVARTRDELEELPLAAGAQVLGPAPAQQKGG